MRLLITTDTVGGVWRFALELTQGLLETGDAVALASFGRRMSAIQREECDRLKIEWGELFTYSDLEVPLEWMRDNECCFSDGAAALLQMAHGFGAQLLHSNQFCYGAAEIGVPKVVTAHSDVLSWARACKSGELERSSWLERYCSLVDKGLRGADAVTAPTAWMLDELGESFPSRPEGAVVPNGRTIVTPPARVRRLQAATVGRLWDEAKDIALLAKTTSPMPLVIAGETECESGHVAPLAGISIRGVLSDLEVLRLFGESAVYVCTSKYEPFGLAPLEAALCGCAVVARDIPSLREIWEDAALWFKNEKELSAILTRLFDDPQFLDNARYKSGEQAKKFSRDRMVHGYRAVYAGIKEMSSVA